MRVIVGCERSGIVRDEFIRLGHNTWSCDLEPSERPGRHLQRDILGVLKDWAETFELGIFFPDCTFLCGSGMHWTTRGLRDPQLTVDAIKFVETIWACDIPKVAIENPVGVLSTRSALGKAAQTIQPYEFGHDASKRTCLWLRGLPLLVPTRFIAPRLVEWPKGSGKIVKRWGNQTDSGQNKLGPSDERAMNRARTYEGVAKAMADQWS